MGLFNFFKKNKQPPAAQPPAAQPPAAKPKQETPDTTAACANDGTRFTFLVEDVFALRDKKGLVAVGNVHGTVRKGDAVYLLHPRTGMMLSEVNGLELNHEAVASATNQPVALLFESIQDKASLEKYTVVTSIRPQPVIDVNTAVENPSLLGLSMEYDRFREDSEYFKLLLHAITQAKFLLAVHMEGEIENKEDGTAVLKESTTMRFPAITDTEKPGANYFPVFTDWTSLGGWTTVFDEKHPPKTVIMPLEDCATIARPNSAAIVVNAFGPVSMALPMDLVEKLAAPRPEATQTEQETK